MEVHSSLSRRGYMKRLMAICLSILMFSSSITVYANEEEYTANSGNPQLDRVD